MSVANFCLPYSLSDFDLLFGLVLLCLQRHCFYFMDHLFGHLEFLIDFAKTFSIDHDGSVIRMHFRCTFFQGVSDLLDQFCLRDGFLTALLFSLLLSL